MSTTNSTSVLDKKRPVWISTLTDKDRRSYSLIPEEIDYVSDLSFSKASAEAKLFGPKRIEVDIPQWTQVSDVGDDAPAARQQRSRLTAEGEATLFLRYNFARYRLSDVVKAQAKRKSAARAREMVKWSGRVLKLRSDIVQANLALVVAMARRTRIPNVDFEEIISEGNMALLRCVEKFDVSRGFKFSTYACRAILKSFNRMATKAGRYYERFPTTFDPNLERSDYDVEKHEMQRQDSVDDLTEILVKNSAHLSDIERTIIFQRFAIGSDEKRRTLAEVGKAVGLTNERVRQLQNQTLKKIRSAIERRYATATATPVETSH